jgi:hypothetical protein
MEPIYTIENCSIADLYALVQYCNQRAQVLKDQSRNPFSEAEANLEIMAQYEKVGMDALNELDKRVLQSLYTSKK